MVREKLAANERIRATQIELGLDDESSLPFLCECDDLSCRTIIRLTAAAYGEARATPHRYVVAAGHPYEGHTVASGEAYVVVEA